MLQPQKLFLVALFCKTLSVCESLDANLTIPGLYDRALPPMKNGNPTQVKVHMTITDVDNVDYRKKTFDVELFLALTWRDDRLSLPTPNPQQGDFYALPSKPFLDQIWSPSVYFPNAKKVSLLEHPTSSDFLWIYSGNYIVRMMKLVASVSCNFDLRTLTQGHDKCKVSLESLSENTNKIELKWVTERPPVVIRKNLLASNVLAEDFVTCDSTSSYNENEFSCVELVLTLKRCPLGFFLRNYAPSCLLVIVSWMAFFFPVSMATSRFFSGLLPLLGLIVMGAISQLSLSLTSGSYDTALDVFMVGCIILVFLNLLLSSIAGMQLRVLSKLPPLFGTDKTYQEKMEKVSPGGQIEADCKKEVFEEADTHQSVGLLDLTMRCVAPLSFTAFTIIFWSVYG